MVLEWLEGETLADHLAHRAGAPFGLEEAVRLIEPAARALSVAHAMKDSRIEIDFIFVITPRIHFERMNVGGSTNFFPSTTAVTSRY